jgi:hypothetical protein
MTDAMACSKEPKGLCTYNKIRQTCRTNAYTIYMACLIENIFTKTKVLLG